MATLAEWQAQQNQNVSTSSQRKKDFNFGSDSSRTHGVYTDDDGATSRVTNAFTNLYASKIIPKGLVTVENL